MHSSTLTSAAIESARAGAIEALAIADAVSDALFAVQSRTVLGFLALSYGDAAAADRDLRALPGWLYSNGWREPTDFAWTNAIEAMIGVGDLPTRPGSSATRT